MKYFLILMLAVFGSDVCFSGKNGMEEEIPEGTEEKHVPSGGDELIPHEVEYNGFVFAKNFITKRELKLLQESSENPSIRVDDGIKSFVQDARQNEILGKSYKNPNSRDLRIDQTGVNNPVPFLKNLLTIANFQALTYLRISALKMDNAEWMTWLNAPLLTCFFVDDNNISRINSIIRKYPSGASDIRIFFGVRYNRIADYAMVSDFNRKNTRRSLNHPSSYPEFSYNFQLSKFLANMEHNLIEAEIIIKRCRKEP